MPLVAIAMRTMANQKKVLKIIASDMIFVMVAV
jgi:hypothetical protein